jgi:murein L,D-transpeptidase YafK
LILTIGFLSTRVNAEDAVRITVSKAKRQLTVTRGSTVLLKIPVALGFAPEGQKETAGDGRTPEGFYTIDRVIPDWEYYKALHISYPTPQQSARAKINSLDPGGGILIHGMKPRWNWIGRLHTFRDWTHGCVAVTNEEMDKLVNLVPLRTVILIEP